MGSELPNSKDQQKVERDVHRRKAAVHDWKKVKEVVELGYWVKRWDSYLKALLNANDVIHHYLLLVPSEVSPSGVVLRELGSLDCSSSASCHSVGTFVAFGGLFDGRDHREGGGLTCFIYYIFIAHGLVRYVHVPPTLVTEHTSAPSFPTAQTLVANPSAPLEFLFLDDEMNTHPAPSLYNVVYI
jgi:hypothetical protein